MCCISGDAMKVGFDWSFRDARVPGQADNRLSLTGELSLGGPNGIFFHDAKLDRADLDLRTVRLIAPAVGLEGRLRLAGMLSGAWRNVTFDGRVEHQDDGRPESAMTVAVTPCSTMATTGTPVFGDSHPTFLKKSPSRAIA